MRSRTDEQIYAAHAHELTVFARSLVGVDNAADIVSESVVAALSAPGWSKVENPRAYLYRAVFAKSQTFLGRRAKRPEVERSVASRAIAADPGEGLVSADVLQAVQGLSAQQRAVVALTYWRDLPVAEVAELLGISDGAVRKHLARARARLREVLDEQR